MPIDAAICETLLKKVGRGGEGRGGDESNRGEGAIGQWEKRFEWFLFLLLGGRIAPSFFSSLSSGRVMQSVSLVIARQILKFPFQYEISKNLFFFDN